MNVRFIHPAVLAIIFITTLSCNDPNRPGSGLSGVWEGTINGYSQVSMNDTPLVVTLTQDDRSLFGTVSLPEADRVHAIENGNLDEFFIRFSFTSAGLVTSFNGTLKARNMEGTWVMRQGQETIESGSWQVRFVSR